MTEREVNVKGQIGEQGKKGFDRRKFLKLAGGGAIATWLAGHGVLPAHGGDELRLPESPRVATLQPTVRSEMKIAPQKEVIPTEFSLEEHDPFSQEGMLENFIAGYSMMTEEQKKEVKTRVTTDPKTGATIYVSKRTADSYMPGLQAGQADKLLRAVTDDLTFGLPQNLTKDIFVVMDQNPETGETVPFMWEIVSQNNERKEFNPDNPDPRQLQENMTYNFPLYKCTMVRENQPTIVRPFHTVLRSRKDFDELDKNMDLLDPFSFHIKWSDKKGQLVLSDGTMIIGEYSNKTLIVNNETGHTIVEPTFIKKPEVLLSRGEILRFNLVKFLKAAPDIFSDPGEVRQYLAGLAGDGTSLHSIRFYPKKNPAVFVLLGNENNGFGIGKKIHRPDNSRYILEALADSFDLLEQLDSSMVDTLQQFGLRVITNKYVAANGASSGDVFTSGDQDNGNGRTARSQSALGLTEIYNESFVAQLIEASLVRSQTKTLQSLGKDKKYTEIAAVSALQVILMEAYEIDYVRRANNEDRSKIDIHYAVTMGKAAFAKSFFRKYRNQFDQETTRRIDDIAESIVKYAIS